MSQKPPTPTDLNLPEKSAIQSARDAGRASAIEAAGTPLAVVMICQMYFRLVASLAAKGRDPERDLETLLDIHRASARLELQALREAGL